MSSPDFACRDADPVELLLKSILRRVSFVAGAGSFAACATALEYPTEDTAMVAKNEPDAGDATASTPSADAAPPVPGDGGLPTPLADANAQVPDARDGAWPWEVGRAIACAPNAALPVVAAGLTPAQPYDYLAIVRRRIDRRSSDASYVTGFGVLSETGRSCATATHSQCAQSASDAAFDTSFCSGICNEESIVTTRGDEVKHWIGSEAARLLLGAIDSPDDALWLVRTAGYDLLCGDARKTSVLAVSDGFEVRAVKLPPAGQCSPCTVRHAHLHVSRSGEVTTLAEFTERGQCACAGRKPAGLRSASVDLGRSLLGDFLASCAHLEAASVVSFERLERELSAHGAPSDLIEAARAARADEVRHAAIVGLLARARGGAPVEPEVEALPVRTLEEIALENSVEGCVHETFAALVAGYQAEHARDRELREAMVGIADDELRHALLAQRVERWIAGELDAPALARVGEAKRRAVRELAREVAVPVAEELQRWAGLPSSTVASALVGELAHSLWAPPVSGSPKAA